MTSPQNDPRPDQHGDSPSAGLPRTIGRERFGELAIEKGLCGDQGELAKLVQRFAGHPDFFPLVGGILERIDTRLDRHLSEFRSGVLYSRTPQEVLQFARLTASIDDTKTLDNTWDILGCKDPEIREAFASDPEALVARAVRASVGVRQVDPSFYFSRYSFLKAEVILDRSSEPAHDLNLVQAGGALSHLSHLQLRAHYDEGHRYLAHMGCFPTNSPYYQSEVDKARAEIPIRVALAKLKDYPPLALQNKLVPRIVALPESIRDSVSLVLQRFAGHKLDYRYFDGFLAAVTRLQSSHEVGRITAAVARYLPGDMISGILVVEELAASPDLITEEAVSAVELGELTALNQTIFRARLEAHQAKFKEKPLEEVRAAFATATTEDSEPPPAAELDAAVKEYEDILKVGNQIIAVSDSVIHSRLGVILESRSQIPPAVFRVQFFALSREIFKREFGVYPYNTQIIAALLLTADTPGSRGRYAQALTGEGKSLLLAISAAYFAAAGDRVDIITSNEYLARRDAQRFKGFFERFGRTATFYAHERESAGANLGSNPDVLYSTNQSLIFGYLGARLNGSTFFQEKRFQTALVDEADNLCLDLTSESCRIAQQRPALFTDEQYQQFLSFVDASDGDALLRDLPTAVAALQKLHGDFTAHSPIILGLHISSAIHSKSLREGRDFIIRDKQVLVVDVRHTGRVREKLIWSNGLHEFVALRNGAQKPPAQGEAAHMSHPSFLKRYERLICISGTFGDRIDRNETRELYGISGFDIPSHHRSQRRDAPLVLHQTSTDWESDVMQRITAQQAAGRPVLVVTQSIEQSRYLYELVRKAGFAVQLLNDHTNVDASGAAIAEQELIDRAGQAGLVTIATSVAGRGADIVPTKEAVAAGGVYALLTFVPHNKRVEDQARGRAGRQGQPGDSVIVADLTEDIFLGSLPDQVHQAISQVVQTYGASSDEMRRLVLFTRRAHGVVDAVMRRVRIEKEEVMERALDSYFSSLRATATELEHANEVVRWGTHQGLGSSLVSMYMGEEWTALYDTANTELSHAKVLDTTPLDYAAALRASRIVPLLKASMARIFPEVSAAAAENSLLASAVLTIASAYASSALHRESKERGLDEEAAQRMVERLKEGVEEARQRSLEHFKGMTREQIEAYQKDWLERHGIKPRPLFDPNKIKFNPKDFGLPGSSG